MTGVDEPHAPRRGSLDLTRLIQRGSMYRFNTRADRVLEGRARDLRMVAGGFLCGVLATIAVAVLAVSWRVVT